MRNGLGAVHHQGGTYLAGAPGDCRDVVDDAEDVRHMDHGDDAGALVDLGREVVLVDAVHGHVHGLELRPGAGAGDLPRDDVRVVLHAGDDNIVATSEHRGRIGRSHQIDRLGGALGPYHLVRRLGVNAAGHGLARGLECLGGDAAQSVGGAMDIGIGAAIVLGDGIEYRLRLLSGGGVVEIDEVCPARDQREVAFAGGDVGCRRHCASPALVAVAAAGAPVRGSPSIAGAAASRRRASSPEMASRRNPRSRRLRAAR